MPGAQPPRHPFCQCYSVYCCGCTPACDLRSTPETTNNDVETVESKQGWWCMPGHVGTTDEARRPRAITSERFGHVSVRCWSTLPRGGITSRFWKRAFCLASSRKAGESRRSLPSACKQTDRFWGSQPQQSSASDREGDSDSGNSDGTLHSSASTATSQKPTTPEFPEDRRYGNDPNTRQHPRGDNMAICCEHLPSGYARVEVVPVLGSKADSQPHRQ